MNEQLITFETAKLAKEKGFEFEIRDDDDYERGLHSFMGKRNDPSIICPLSHWFLDTNQNSQQWVSTGIDAPTQSLLQRWLRENHHIIVEPRFMGGLTRATAWYDVVLYSNNAEKDNSRLTLKYKTYEEALEAGLIEALKIT